MDVDVFGNVWMWMCVYAGECVSECVFVCVCLCVCVCVCRCRGV